jgi:integrase
MITETGKINTSSTHMYIWSLKQAKSIPLAHICIYDHSLIWLGTGTSIRTNWWSWACFMGRNLLSYWNDAVIQVLSKWCGHTSVVQRCGHTSVILMMRSYKCCSNDAVIQVLSKWCGHTSVILMMRSYKCCPNDAVIQVLSKWCGHTSVVQMMRSYKCCPNDAVIQVLSKWCGHKSVVQMMRSYRCCPNVSKLSTLTYKDGLLQLLFSQLNVKHRRYQSVNNIYKIHYNLA